MNRRRLPLLGLAVSGLLGALASPAAASPGYLTLTFDRAQYVEVVKTGGTCTALPNTVTLPAVFDELQRRGYAPVVQVVTGYTGETARLCRQPGLIASWADLRAWHVTYGLEAVSLTKTKPPDMRKLSAAQQQDESCGTLPIFEMHGFDRAWGLFNYPNDSWTVAMQQSVVSPCFAYGRDYNGAVNINPVPAPYFARVREMIGGDCNATGQPCTNGPAPRRYVLPSVYSAMMVVKPDQWRVLQAYRFAVGVEPGKWDCTSPDPRLHWTWKTETYCWADYLTILDAVPRDGTVVVTDPAAVALAWHQWPRP
jgi:hypothetical protein